MIETKESENRQKLYDSIKKVKDEYTKNVLYSQFVDKYYVEAFNAITDFTLKSQSHRNKERKEEEVEEVEA